MSKLKAMCIVIMFSAFLYVIGTTEIKGAEDRPQLHEHMWMPYEFKERMMSMVTTHYVSQVYCAKCLTKKNMP